MALVRRATPAKMEAELLTVGEIELLPGEPAEREIWLPAAWDR